MMILNAEPPTLRAGAECRQTAGPFPPKTVMVFQRAGLLARDIPVSCPIPEHVQGWGQVLSLFTAGGGCRGVSPNFHLILKESSLKAPAVFAMPGKK